jgi:hypothetical protein
MGGIFEEVHFKILGLSMFEKKQSSLFISTLLYKIKFYFQKDLKHKNWIKIDT